MEKKIPCVTPAEKHLVEKIKSFLGERPDEAARILNIGAGKSIVIENQVFESGRSFVCDRVDIEKHQLDYPFIGNVYNCSVENMEIVKSARYEMVLANYVLEHVQNVDKAASEIHRVLKDGGMFVTSIPNPTALEFIISKRTPLWLHEMVRGRTAWHTYYAFRDVEGLLDIFQKAGFVANEVLHWSFVESYMKRFVVMRQLATLYDKALTALGYKRFMNNVCIVFEKTERVIDAR